MPFCITELSKQPTVLAINKTEEPSLLESCYSNADFDMSFEAEKIGILSIIYDLPQDTTTAIIRDYLAMLCISENYYSEEPTDFIEVIDTITSKHEITRKKITSLIFSYQYEMVTKDEIISHCIDNMDLTE